MPPKDPSDDDLTQLLYPHGAPLAGPASSSPTTPPATSPPSRGAGRYEVRRRELLKVADEMRNDIKAVEQAVQALKIQVHQVGDWDVAQQLASKVNTAHTNMLDVLDQYVQVASAIAGQVENSAKTYGKAEQGAKAASQTPTPKNVTPW
ncbi:hypothetical protein [Actinomadura montaniterrae]|uniref:Uncharacterized protein n=1 Tax=Actinomadura montaniterrae TaxID=1803903 RepID=A0A6L3VVR7_9ACTN|nr:hypothetical protein [Actinomadura montaniterrae]KAB2373330.1 hypothetical protein F9B16_28805 [Actinomadura montaniterrae]